MAQSDDKDFKLPDDVNISNLVSDLQVKVSDITRKATIRDATVSPEESDNSFNLWVIMS